MASFRIAYEINVCSPEPSFQADTIGIRGQQGGPVMTPFVKVQRNVATCMEHRLALMQQSSEFFRRFFGGRIPSEPEKALWIEQAVQRMTSIQIYENDTYIVEVRYHPPFVQLDVRRRDHGDCKNWRELQQIKNEIVGPEHEAVELFPAESRLVDTANQYHLWVHVSPDYRFPFGFVERCVLSRPVVYERYVMANNVASPAEHHPVHQVA
jgi:hypothetical protein